MTTNGCLFATSESSRATSNPPAETTLPSRTESLPPAAEHPSAPLAPAYVPGAPLLLTEREAAKALAVSPRKLWDLRMNGEIPCVRFGRSVRYHPADLQAWIARTKATA